MMDIKVQIYLPSQWEPYMNLRLRALKTNPEAFGRSYEDEVLFDSNIWKERLNSSTVIVALKEKNEIGLVVLSQSKENKQTFHIGSMWVDPKFRSLGIGTKLVEKLLSEARLKGAHKITGGCMKDNENAVSFYLNKGFELTGTDLPVEKDPKLRELEICYSFESPKAKHMS